MDDRLNIPAGLRSADVTPLSLFAAPKRGPVPPDDVPPRHSRGQPAIVRPVARILLADDEASLAKFLATRLQKHGFEVEIASSMPRALAIAIARRKELDLIILDLVFKDGSGIDGFGLDVLRRLRAAHVSTRVMIYTSHPADDSRLAAAELEVMRYVEKQNRGRAFVGEVKRALAGPGPNAHYGSLFRPLGDERDSSHIVALLVDLLPADGTDGHERWRHRASQRLARFLAEADLSLCEFDVGVRALRMLLDNPGKSSVDFTASVRALMGAARAREAVPIDRAVDIVSWRTQAAVNAGRHLRLDLAATYAAVKAKELDAMLDAAFGTEFHRCMHLTILRRAVLELATTGDEVHLLAMRLGHVHHSGFSRVFHDTTGLSPTAYRRLLLPDPPDWPR